MKRKMAKALAVLMCLMTTVAFMPTFAFAADGEEVAAQEPQTVTEEGGNPKESGTEQEREPAADAKVNFTVNNKGVLAKDKDGKIMAYRDVTVKDIDKDGKLTYDEALKAAHETYCDGGIDSYSAVESTYGMTVSKLWGVDTYNTLMFINGKGIQSDVGTDEVKEGDSLYASINADNTNYADWYTAFDKTNHSMNAGEEISLTLTGGQGMEYPADFTKPVQNVNVGYWKNGEFVSLGKTGSEDGKVDFRLYRNGEYYITATGTVNDTNWSGDEIEAPIMAPVCVVTVTGETEETREAEIDEQNKVIKQLKEAVAALKAAAIMPNAKASAKATSVTLSWTAAEEVAGYEVSEDGGNTWNAVSGNSKIFSGLAVGKKYTYQVRGFVYSDGQGTKKFYSEASEASATTTLAKAAITSLKSKSKKLTVKWNKVEGAKAYQVYISTNAKFTKGLIKYSTSANSKVSKKLKKGKKYYVKVRAYSGKIYGAWSATKTIKAK